MSGKTFKAYNSIATQNKSKLFMERIIESFAIYSCNISDRDISYHNQIIF